MVVWLAFAVSAVALVVSVASAVYARRQALAAEDAIWSASPSEFEASVENPNGGAANLVIEYQGGRPLDQVDIGCWTRQLGHWSDSVSGRRKELAGASAQPESVNRGDDQSCSA